MLAAVAPAVGAPIDGADAQAWPETTLPADATRSMLQDRRILVVEDDYLIASDLAQELQAFGATVVGPAGSVAQATALIACSLTLDGSVLDIHLGHETAYPLADALAAQGVPYVFTTGYDGWMLPARYADVPRCEKPVNVAMLARMLARRMTR